MFDSPIIDVALGLILVFFLLATVASAVTEVVESFLNRRADFLEASLGSLMGTSYAKNILTHPIIKRSNPGKGAPDIGSFTVIRKRLKSALKRVRMVLRMLVASGAGKAEGRPSYIPSHTFSNTVLDLLEGSGKSAEMRLFEIQQSVDAVLQRTVPEWIETSLAAFESGGSEDQILAEIEVQASAQLTAAPNDTTAGSVVGLLGGTAKAKKKLVDIKIALEAASDGVITSKEAMEALDRYLKEVKSQGGTAAQQIDGLRVKIETWFDDAMDQVSGWYKQRTKALLFVWSLLVVLVLNVDAFAISSTLWSSDAVREAVVAQAQSVSANPETCSIDDKIAAGDPFGCVTEGIENVEALSLPVGWPGAPWDWSTSDPTVPDDVGGWFGKAVGLLVTAGAAAMGAPFWFELMNKVINLRASGKPPAKKEAQPATA